MARTLIAGGKNGGLTYHALEPAGWKKPVNWKADDYQRAWETLAGSDPAKAYAAVWDLSALGEESVRLLAKQMKAAAPAGRQASRSDP